jgi:demethylmenaquinone methyltransferase / 2-methoxy-6-polyprenyl-1,4-benzoquinol methylase
LNLPLESASVDVLTIAYGVRNLANRELGLREMRRVLRPGGRLLCLEFTRPAAWLRPPYFFYLRYILPPLARMLTGDRAAYQYLAGTVQSYPAAETITEEMRAAGFAEVRATPLTLSVMALHEAIVGPS